MNDENNINKLYSIVIDFQDYLLPSGDNYAFKEFTIIYTKPKKMIYYYTYVTSPLCPWRYLSSEYKTYYRKLLNSYGVKWEVGTVDFVFMRQQFQAIFKDADIIYVRNSRIKYILKNYYPNDEYNIISLDSLGYNDEVQLVSNCLNHNHNLNYCTEQTAQYMTNWIIKNS